MAIIVNIKKVFNNVCFFEIETKQLFRHVEGKIYYLYVEDSPHLMEIFYLHENRFFYCGLISRHISDITRYYKITKIIENIILEKSGYKIINYEQYLELKETEKKHRIQDKLNKQELDRLEYEQKQNSYIQKITDKIKNKNFITGNELLLMCKHLEIKLHIRTVGCIKKLLQVSYNQYQGKVTNTGGTNACNVYKQIYMLES